MTSRDHLAVPIRAFESDDAPAVSELIATTMRRSNVRDYPLERLEVLIAYFTPDKLRDLARERYCLVAVVDGRLVGTAAREGGELATFFVRPDHQGRGIGARLLEALEQEGCAAGLSALRVDASLTGTPFYERRGYRRTGDMAMGTAGPHVSLVKDLREAAG